MSTFENNQSLKLVLFNKPSLILDGLFLFNWQYEAVTVPFPKDVETPKINEKEKELVRFVSRYVYRKCNSSRNTRI